MFSQKLVNIKILSVKPNFLLRRYVKENAVTKIKKTNLGFDPLPKKKPQRESYLKSLILGNVDKEVFTYPEELPGRYENYVKWLQPIEYYILSCINKNLDKNEVLLQLRELNLFQAYINEENFGITLSEIESMKLIETVSNLPWLGTYMVKNHILPIQIISKYGSKSQKLEYYSKIMNGELIPSICIYEDSYGTNVNNFETYVVKNTEDSWLLNGKKQYVVNGLNSNLFLVYAKHKLPNMKQTTTDSFSLFLVEKDFGNVACTDVYDTIDERETPICTISFTDTVVPNKNMIGSPGSAFKSLMESLKPGTQNVTGRAISILRNFMMQLVPDITQMRHYDRDFYQFDIVKQIIAEMTITLYTMESMAYLTTGMIDQYENIDADLEKIITETYCANSCLKCIQKGLQLVGVHGYVNNKSYIQAFHDAIALTTLDTNNIDASTYVGASMLQYIGKTIIGKVKEGMSLLLENSGSQITEQYADLKQVAVLLTELYALYANILRASRSYSIGVRNADLEKDFVTKVTTRSYYKICTVINNIEIAPMFNNYTYYSDVMDTVYGKKKYPMEHPLTRTF
ncbi:Acyl-CoA dehydrogenase family member 9, mitochondrial [Eufriesea mexicana]|nr:Acyl-CoA dehydrogenase family member 9, mitochondrial [Eufriesea mexicana]